MRGAGNVALAITGVVVVIALIRRGCWRRSIATKLLVLLWCLAPVSMLGAHIVFEVRKRDVLQTEVAQAHLLGQHFVVGYSSFEEVARLAEKGLISGVYISRRNLSGRTAEALRIEIAALQERRRTRQSSTADRCRRSGGRHRLASVAGADEVAGARDAGQLAAGRSRPKGRRVRPQARPGTRGARRDRQLCAGARSAAGSEAQPVRLPHADWPARDLG